MPRLKSSHICLSSLRRPSISTDLRSRLTVSKLGNRLDGKEQALTCRCLSCRPTLCLRKLTSSLDSRSVWLGYIPTLQVDPLAALIVNRSSVFYHSKRELTKQLAGSVDPVLPILSFYGLTAEQEDATGGNGGAAAQETATLSNKKTALIASAAALGAIILGVGGFFASRYAMRKRKEFKHSQQGGSQGYGGDDDGENMQETARGIQPGFQPLVLPPNRYRNPPKSAEDPDPEGQEDALDRDSLSQYPVTERHQTEDFYNSAPAASFPNESSMPMPVPMSVPVPVPMPIPAAALMATPSRGDDGRQLFDTGPLSPPVPDSAYPFPHQRPSLGPAQHPQSSAFYPMSSTPGANSPPVNQSYLDTVRSGSGSSVQSEMLHTRRRVSSMDIPIRNTWWKHQSQWENPTQGQGASSGSPPLPALPPQSQPLQPLPSYLRESRPYSGSSTYSTLRNFNGPPGFPSSQPGTLKRGHRRTSTKISTPFLQDNSLML